MTYKGIYYTIEEILRRKKLGKIRLAIVGCGGMGHRHLAGLAELHRAGLNHFELVGVCDPVSENAESLAQQAKGHFEEHPTVVSNLGELAALGIESVDTELLW